MFQNAYSNRRVFVTGHTGFKGSWLCQWLLNLGAQVHGYAFDPEPHERLFGQLSLADRIASDVRGDVRDLASLKAAVDAASPEIVFHLAAQPLVRKSFAVPVETFETNVMGTVNVLETIRTSGLACSVVVVTTDKCYENREWSHAYREEDPMGGYDPYSASKGCAELVVNAYRRSFFSADASVRLASARAGNVIGGGDWAIDRIVPDVFRAIFAEQAIAVRNKRSTRPWQHVLEPLSGYLWLAARLHLQSQSPPDGHSPDDLRTAFNFGPALSSNRTVAELVEEVLRHAKGNWVDQSDPHAPHEAGKLNLATDKAFHLLGWNPTWDFAETIRQTAMWYLSDSAAGDAIELTQSQIDSFIRSSRSAWSQA